MRAAKVPKRNPLTPELDLRAIRIFVAVAEAGSFVAGGTSVGLTRSAAGKALSRLEDYLGTRLFHRTTRRLSLTTEGHEFYSRCLQIIEDVQEAEASIRHDHPLPRGTLRLTVSEGYGKAIVIPFLGSLLAASPELSVEVNFTDRIVDLVEEGFDLAIRVGEGVTSTEYVTQVIARARPRLYAAPGYLEKQGVPLSTSGLEKHQRLIYGLGTTTTAWNFIDKEGQSVSVNGRIHARFDSGDAIRVAATEGMGIGLLPPFVVARELNEGKLVEVLPSISAAELAVHVIYPSRRYLPARIRTFIDEFRKYLNAKESEF
ncbi:LysR family transcriptional regulator [Klebsiella oxytoca]|uniref:LysR family transcriptional regulator n=1 Tax=Klebsiella oxytoca TaxID=571 RepID=UPI00292C9BC7|nr:LysR family transcriptional regulator [Klebsiella pneumoniae]